MENIRTSKLLKFLSYILIPILVALIILSMIHLAFLDEFGNSKETKYEETQNFADNYLYFILDKISECSGQKTDYARNYIKIEDKYGKKYYYSQDSYFYNYYHSIGEYIDYIIINKQTNEMYTNMKSSNYDQEIENLKTSNYHWNYANGKIETDLKYINSDNIIYNSTYIYFDLDSNGENVTTNDNTLANYEIYSRYNENKTNQLTNFKMVKELYQFALEHQTLPIYILPITIILLAIIVIYLLWAIGHEKGKEDIVLNSIDKIPYEILSIIGLSILTIFLTITIELIHLVNYITLIAGILIYLICYAIVAVFTVTTIKRIKAKKFLKSFLIYKLFVWIRNKYKKIQSNLKIKIQNKEIFWYFWGFIIISIILALFLFSSLAFFAFLLLIIFWVFVYCKIKQYLKKQEEIKEALEDIYNGKKEVYIDEKELKGTLKQMAIYINDISGGFSNAIQESLKSERLKTELITNVSHDIKTPLTSIINYVDLLKKENIQDEKIKEYIEILDQKSQRLKKLTEDLVEASKASSGNIKLNIEEINLKELINQCIGEFKDKFEQKQLIIETNMPNEEIKIKADNRYMYRIIENLFSNITKYALENSRVYIDLYKEGKKIKVSMKNISKDKLNISEDELMQRFVRGDKSRYTEGSGLRPIDC